MAGKIKNNKHLINAPAGSGKTTYIRNELKSICLNNPESRILCITYTNRAADELKKNLEGANITVSTIHSYINDLISPFYSHKEVLDLYWEIYAEKIKNRIKNVTNDENIKKSNQYYIEKYGESQGEEDIYFGEWRDNVLSTVWKDSYLDDLENRLKDSYKTYYFEFEQDWNDAGTEAKCKIYSVVEDFDVY